MNFQLYSTMEIWTAYLVFLEMKLMPFSFRKLGNDWIHQFWIWKFFHCSRKFTFSFIHDEPVLHVYPSLSCFEIVYFFFFSLAKGWSPRVEDQSLDGNLVGTSGFHPTYFSPRSLLHCFGQVCFHCVITLWNASLVWARDEQYKGSD